jgi:hypothetical protein
MKKIFLLILFFLTLNSKLFSQGNLQFNQVISESGSISGSVYTVTYNSPNSYTVPSGKVWKIESVSFMITSVNTSYSQRFFLKLNSNQVLSNQGGTSIYDRAGTLNNEPIWLKSGDVITFGMINNCSPTCSQSATFHLSALEFNVIP